MKPTGNLLRLFPFEWDFGLRVVLIVGLPVFLGAAGFVVIFAGGELIDIFLDIEANTRAMAKSSAD